MTAFDARVNSVSADRSGGIHTGVNALALSFSLKARYYYIDKYVISFFTRVVPGSLFSQSFWHLIRWHAVSQSNGDSTGASQGAGVI